MVVAHRGAVGVAGRPLAAWRGALAHLAAGDRRDHAPAGPGQCPGPRHRPGWTWESPRGTGRQLGGCGDGERLVVADDLGLLDLAVVVVRGLDLGDGRAG